jgi:hypothetical protein
MNDILEHWELIASIVTPIITIAVTIGWAAGAYVLRTNAKVLSELAVAIEELREQTRAMSDTYQKDMRTLVTKEYCQNENTECNKKRDAFRSVLEKKLMISMRT